MPEAARSIIHSTITTLCSLKGHTHSNKPAPFRCRFVYVCLIFLWIPEMKGLKITNESPVQENVHRRFKIPKKN